MCVSAYRRVPVYGRTVLASCRGWLPIFLDLHRYPQLLLTQTFLLGLPVATVSSRSGNKRVFLGAMPPQDYPEYPSSTGAFANVGSAKKEADMYAPIICMVLVSASALPNEHSLVDHCSDTILPKIESLSTHTPIQIPSATTLHLISASIPLMINRNEIQN